MNISGGISVTDGYSAAYRNPHIAQKESSDIAQKKFPAGQNPGSLLPETGNPLPKTDRVEISDDARRFMRMREQLPQNSIPESDFSISESNSSLLESDFSASVVESDVSVPENNSSVPESDSVSGEQSAEDESAESSGGAVSINVSHLSRKLAAAETQSQIRAVMAEIQSDLKECESGRAQGLEVDETSVAAAEQLLQEAQQRMGQAENREPTPEENNTFSLASLF